MAHQPLRLHVLDEPGLFELEGKRVDLPLGKPFALLCFIALEDGPVTRTDLGHLLWSSVSEERARQSVRQALWTLRQVVPAELIVTEGEDVSIGSRMLDHDVGDLRRALATGRLAEALELWGEGPFTGFSVPDAPRWNYWADQLRSDLEEGLRSALEDRAAAAIEAGDRAEGLGWIESAIRVVPHAPNLHALRIQTLLELGRLEDAEAAVLKARDTLGAEGFDRLSTLEAQLRELRRSRFKESRSSFTVDFVGRRKPFARLVTLWRAVRRNQPRFAVVTGPAGVGKTRLSEEFVEYARLDGAEVISCRGAPDEANLRWAVTVDLVRQLYRRPGAAGVGRASDSLLRALVPTLSTSASNPELADRVDLAAGPVIDAVADLVAAVGHEQPLVIFVDDLQWVDEASRGLLSKLPRSVPGTPLLQIGTWRTPGASRGLEGFREKKDRDDVTLIPLDPLDEADIQEMLEPIGGAGSRGREGRLGRRIHRVTGGNPLFVVELLHEMRKRGLLVSDDEAGWRLTTTELAESDLDLPESLRASVMRQIQQLPDPARALLRMLARSSHGLGSGDLERAAKDIPELEGAQQDLLDAGLARYDLQGRLQLAHDTHREAALEILPEKSRPGWRPTSWQIAAGLVLLLSAAAALVLYQPTDFDAFGPGGYTYTPDHRDVYSIRFSNDLTRTDTSLWDEFEIEPYIIYWDREFFPTTQGILVFGRRFPSSDPRSGTRIYQLFRDSASGTWTETTVVSDSSGRLHIEGPSPDGTELLFADERIGESIDLRIKDLRTGEVRTLVTGLGPTSKGYSWSPNGAFIAGTNTGREAEKDSILILYPDGTVRNAFEVSNPSWVAWCGNDEIAVLREGDDLQRIEVMNVRTGERIHEVQRVLDSRLACSPQGRLLIYAGLDRRRPVLLAHALDDGQEMVLEREFRGNVGRWLQYDPPAVPAEIRLEGVPERLVWGDKISFDAEVVLSDGRKVDDGVIVESGDSLVISVLDGELVANGVGTAFVTAAHTDGWPRDSIEVSVVGGRPNNVLFFDPLTEIDTEVWDIDSTAHVLTRSPDGDTVLAIGSGLEAWFLNPYKGFQLPRGGTFQVEFRFRRDESSAGRHFHVVLEEWEMAAADDSVRSDQFEFLLPTDLTRSIESGTARMMSRSGLDSGIRLPANFSPYEWNRLGFQLLPDGTTSLYLNGVFLSESPIRFRNEENIRWRFSMQAGSGDREVYVRNYTVWSPPRFTR